MKKEFGFLEKRCSLAMDSSTESDGNFQKCVGSVYNGRIECRGVFKLTQLAWKTANEKAQVNDQPLDEVLVNGCMGVLKAELYIREISDGFIYVVDHRFFEKL